METDFLPLDLPLIVYSGGDALQTKEVTPPSISNFVLPPKVHSTLHHAASLDEISQYYVLPGKQDKLDFIVYDTPGDNPLVDQELPLSGECSPLQTIFSVRASGKPNHLEVKVPVTTHWDLNLLENLLAVYEDKLVVDFLRYGWPMSRSILPLTNGSAKINHKGTLDFPGAINHYLATEHSNNTLFGPFFTNPFPDRSASSPLNLVLKHDSEKWRVILDEFPTWP